MQQSELFIDWAQRLNIPKYTKVYVICMDICTIKLRPNTKRVLDSFREYRNESYDEVVAKLIGIAKNVRSAPELSLETVESIERARKRIKAGNFITDADAKKRLGL